jgi:hypothetical protein
MYGGGAVLIREVVRRTGRGWPSIVLLALAYALLEEGFTTMSLFNPDYLGAHLLDRGFVPALGIAIPWTVFVLALHTVWSISVPIALTEECTDRRTTPWLRTPGLTVVAVIFTAGVVLDFALSYRDGHYLASSPKLAVTGAAIVLLVLAALRMPCRSEPVPVTSRPAPAPWLVLTAVLALGGLFMAAGIDALPAWAGTAMLLVAVAAAVAAIGVWSRRAGWGAWHRYAAAAGALLTYAWHSFLTPPVDGWRPGRRTGEPRGVRAGRGRVPGVRGAPDPPAGRGAGGHPGCGRAVRSGRRFVSLREPAPGRMGSWTAISNSPGTPPRPAPPSACGTSPRSPVCRRSARRTARW